MYADINANDITIAQSIFVTGNAVTDDVIDGRTDSSRERRNGRASLPRRHCSIAYITGDRPSATNILFSNFVDFSGRDSCFQVWTYHFIRPVSYTHLRAHETRHDLVCRLLLEK